MIRYIRAWLKRRQAVAYERTYQRGYRWAQKELRAGRIDPATAYDRSSKTQHWDAFGRGVCDALHNWE